MPGYAEVPAGHLLARCAGPGNVSDAFPLDVTDVEATAATVGKVEAELGPIAALVNNVGWNGKAEFFLNLTPDRWRKAFELNLFSTFNVTHAVLPRMVELIVNPAIKGTALASVIGGVTSAPVVAVPTSVGYGSSFDGITALLAMHASCASGVTVVGIDNGFGAACAIARMMQ